MALALWHCAGLSIANVEESGCSMRALQMQIKKQFNSISSKFQRGSVQRGNAEKRGFRHEITRGTRAFHARV